MDRSEREREQDGEVTIEGRERPDAPPRPEPDEKSAKILMVDDEPTTLEILEIFLQAEGYENLIQLNDSTRALETVAEERPDLVLLDVMMPEIGGLEILRALRADEALASTPVIILTSATDPETKLAALELGATEFLAKPVDPSELALRLRNTLAFKAYQGRFGSSGGKELVERLDRALRRSGPPVISRLASQPQFRGTIKKFVARLDEKLEWMEARFEADQYNELAVLAHWLKGSAVMVGFDAFAGPADTLEVLAREGKTEEMKTVLRDLHVLAERIVVPGEEE